MSKYTPGPWRVEIDAAKNAAWPMKWPTIQAENYEVVGVEGLYGDIETDIANAHLIAAAPDHALFSSALVAGKIRWEAFAGNAEHGEICVGGMRWATKLDEFGVPVLTENTRAAIAKATGQTE